MKTKNEIWKDIAGYENQYQASNFGKIKSLDRKVWNYNKKGRVLKQNISTSGYSYVSLNGKKYYVHILVAQTFIDNPNNYKQVNHKDFNKQNNNVDNLEWVTPQQNLMHYRKSKYFKQVNENKQNKLSNKTIEKILKYKNSILGYYKCGFNIKEISKKTKLGRDFITNVILLYKEYIFKE